MVNQPSRSTIFRTGRLLTPSMPVSSSAFPARPPQPSWRILARMSRTGRARRAACTSLTICTLPQRAQSMRRNQDGKAANGSSSASAPVGCPGGASGAWASCSSRWPSGNRARGHLAGPWPHFARSSHAPIRAVASGSSLGSVACSVRRSLARLRLLVVTIADFAAGGGDGRRSSFAGGGGAGSGFCFPPLGTPAAVAFRTIVGPAIATAFHFLAGRL